MHIAHVDNFLDFTEKITPGHFKANENKGSKNKKQSSTKPSTYQVAVQSCHSRCARPVSVTPSQSQDAAALTSLHRNVYLRKVCVHSYTFIKRSCFLGVGL